MKEPYWWEKKEPEEPEEPEGTHFLDSLVEEIKIKPEEEPYFLDEVVKGIAKPEEEIDILDETIRTIETEEKEKTGYWWLDAWQKAQDAYTWMYPEGYGQTFVNTWKPVLETTSYAIGDAATFLARRCPNQEDLPAYRDQALPRQALTLAQGTSVVALGILIGATGISALSGLVKFLAYGRADKIAAKFATQHFDKIKALNPQVKNPEDAIALTQASLRGVIKPTVETTYLPTTMQQLTKLGKTLLTPLSKSAPTAQFKIAMGEQVRNMVTQAGVEPTAKMLEPFTQTLDHFVGSPVSGIVSKEYGAAIVDVINKHFPPMIEQIIDTGETTLPFEKPIIAEDRVVEDVEEIVDMAMREKPLTEEEIFAEAKEAYLLLDKFTKGDEADKASQLFPEEEIAPTKQMAMYQQELKKLQDAGITGKEAEKAALETAGLKYKPKEITPPPKQLKWEFGRATIKGQKEFELRLPAKAPEEEADVFIGKYHFKVDAEEQFEGWKEAHKSDQMVAEYARLTKQEDQLRPGGFIKGLQDDPEIVKISEDIYLAQGLTKEGKAPPEPVTPNFTKVAELEKQAQAILQEKLDTLPAAKAIEAGPEPGTPGYIEWWKTLPQDKQDAELLRKQTPEIERLITGELEEMRTEVEEGKPGKRIRTEEGKWMGQPSTYPDFMGEFGLTKKGIMKAYETKKGKTWGLLQDIARDRVAMGYEHPTLGMVEPMVTKAESDYLVQMREISEEIPEKIIVNEHLGIAESKLENTPGQPITEKDYAKLAGKYDGQTKALDLTQFDKDTLWMQQVDEQLNSPATSEERGRLTELMTKRGIEPEDQKYLLRSMTRDKAKSIDNLTREEATLITNYLEILPTWDPDVPIPTIAPAEPGKGDPGHWAASLFDYAQNVEAWSERMEAKYPDTKLFTNIFSPVIQARRTTHRKKTDLLRKGLEAIKGLTREEMRDIQLWCEEETRGIEHTVTLSEAQEETRAKLLEGINEVADLCELAEEERVPGLGYMPRRYRKEFLERLGIRKRKYDFSALPFDWLSHPKTFKPFFKYERSIEDAPEGAKLDLYASYSQYIRQGLRAHFRDVLESTGPDVKNLPPKLRNYVERWANLASGMPGFGEQLYLNTMGKVKVNKKAALFLERTTMDFVYMGGLGLKISFAGKNATQFLHGLSEIPEPWVLHGLGKMFTKEGKELWEKSGCQMYYAPFLARGIPKAKGAYQKIKNALMILVQKSDQLNREPVYIADHDRTLHYGKLYQEGSIDWTELIRKIDIKRYEKPFQDIVLRHIEKGENEIAADLMGDRVQAYTNWRYWAMVSPMLLQEGGPMSAQFAVWGFNNVDLMWRRRLERGTKLIREGEVKSGVYQYGKIIRHLIYMGILGKALQEGTKRVIGKKYEVGPREMIQFLVAGSVPTSLAPIPGMAMALLPYTIHKLSGRDWLAAEKAKEIKRSARVFIPGNLSFRDWQKALEKEAPGEAAMQLVYPQFRAEPTPKKRGWYEPAKPGKKEGKRGWYESPGRKEEEEKKGWWE